MCAKGGLFSYFKLWFAVIDGLGAGQHSKSSFKLKQKSKLAGKPWMGTNRAAAKGTGSHIVQAILKKDMCYKYLSEK